MSQLATAQAVRVGREHGDKRMPGTALEAPECESSITVHDAVRIDWDAAVVGAGPAGALAARQLARCGLRTLLVDRSSFPRGKVCGGCISGQGRQVLGSVGLERLLQPPAAEPLDRFDLAAHGRRVSLPLTSGAAVSRFCFDAQLVREAVSSGAAFLGGTAATVRGLTGACHFRRVGLQCDDASGCARARVVIVADGLGRTSLRCHRGFAPQVAAASRIGLGVTLPACASELERGRVLMCVAREGYVGMVRIPGDALNLAAAVDPNTVRQHGPVDAVRGILIRAGVNPPSSLESAEWRGTGLLTRHSPRISARRLLVLGDAAGYVEPFTGEGMTWGMFSAILVAPLVLGWLNCGSAANQECLASRRGPDALSRAWSTVHRTHIAHRQRDCRILAGLLRNSAAVAVAMRLMSLAPNIARPFIRHFWNSGNGLEATVQANRENRLRSASQLREEI